MLSRNMFGIVAAGILSTATAVSAQFTALENPSFTDTALSAWKSNVDTVAPVGTLTRDTVVFSSAPASLKVMDPDNDANGTAFDNGFWTATNADTSGKGWPSKLILSFKVKQQAGSPEVSVSYNVLGFKADWSFMTWLGSKSIPLSGATTWTTYSDTSDLAAFSNVWESFTLKRKMIDSLKVRTSNGRGNLVISLRCEVKNTTANFDDFVLTQLGTGVFTRATADQAKRIGRQMALAAAAGKMGPTSGYRLTVLGADGRTVATPRAAGLHLVNLVTVQGNRRLPMLNVK